ncbi:HAD family hydrolase [Corynebacterium hindlerae]|uniref:HAD family hydrolase n=1 Tax=Corynebacterium hindlerae TaxID=699041 RepID=A0A7G5FI49_9CORY|nr:HAD family hydrolase [Corynebacterium hindlerae]QMV86290.1 HAD family hydrolase [Corynebacterium hindlerae]
MSSLGRSSETTHGAELQTPRVAAFFDLDKTIIATSSAYAFGREFMSSGLISPRAALQMSLAQATYILAGHTSEQMDNTRDQLTSMIAGWEVEQVRQIAEETMKNVVSPAIYQEARDLIRFHQNLGHDVIIISASATELVVPIAKELGVTQIVATELATKDGVLTGEVLFYAKGPAKAEEIRRLAEENGYDLDRSFAYSDSATDIPMLEAVGNAVAVNPDRPLRRAALANDWEIKTFKNPVPLFTVPSTKEVSIGTGVVATIAAVTAAGVWLYRNNKNS